MSKLKVLLVNEFSQLATGFSVMGDLLLRELHKEYEVAELACYINPLDPRIEDMPWKVYPAQPTPDNMAAWQRHNNNPTAQFGSDVFNDVLMDFQPDVVISWRDCWMDTFIQQTPFRNRFKWIYMPTVDGEPQRLDWLFLYKQADYINTYTRWAKNLLEREGIKVFAAASPGPDTETFSPPDDKRGHKEKMGLNPDWYIIGSVMRNQPRKLFPDILRAFSLYLKEVETNGTEEEKQKAANAYLHFHTSLTDVGWDIASEIQRYNLSHKTLLTYVDERTGEAYLSFYKGITAWSMLSPNQKCARTPNTSGNLNRKQLADIVKCYDLYVQYSIAEGFGLPVLEANSCGVPAMGLGYSATAELVEEPHNVDLPIAGWKQELPTETSQLRAVGDVPGLARQIRLEVNRGFDAERSAAARQCVLDKYNHRTFTDGFRGILVQIDASGFRAIWKDQPYIYQPKITEVPNFILNEDFIIWCNQNILGRPYLLTKDTLDSQSKMLETGRRVMDNGVPRTAPFTREMMMNELIDVNNRINEMEVIRYHACNKIPLPQRQKFQVL